MEFLGISIPNVKNINFLVGIALAYAFIFWLIGFLLLLASLTRHLYVAFALFLYLLLLGVALICNASEPSAGSEDYSLASYSRPPDSCVRFSQSTDGQGRRNAIPLCDRCCGIANLVSCRSVPPNL